MFTPLHPHRAPHDDIRQHVHWSKDVMLKYYALILPQSVHKSPAGYSAMRKCYFNERQAVQLPEGMGSALLIY